ncbi:MAG: hypothetical protein FWD02_06820 [Bacteroidales bacterium]|nr:hypothetical protein [Bacteroidales bacterium]
MFWFPTIFHEEPKIKIKSRKIVNPETGDGFYDLSDKDSCLSYFAKFRLSEKDDIIITSKVKTIDDISFIEFDTTLFLCGNKRKNGFVQFSFDESQIEERFRKAFTQNLTKSMSSKIKEFYHEHECHTDKDSDLTSLVSDSEIDLEEENNKALINFLEKFSKLFYKRAVNISNFNKKVRKSHTDYVQVRDGIWESPRSHSAARWQKFFTGHLKVTKQVSVLGSLCEDALIEYTYCKTLLTSIYNTSFKLEMDKDKKAVDFETRNDNRRNALNIRNSIRYIENIKYKNQNRQFALLHLSDRDIKDIAATVHTQNEKIDQTLDVNKVWQGVGISLAMLSIFFGLKTTETLILDPCFILWFGRVSVLLLLLSVLFAIYKYTQFAIQKLRSKRRK